MNFIVFVVIQLNSTSDVPFNHNKFGNQLVIMKSICIRNNVETILSY